MTDRPDRLTPEREAELRRWTRHSASEAELLAEIDALRAELAQSQREVFNLGTARDALRAERDGWRDAAQRAEARVLALEEQLNLPPTAGAIARLDGMAERLAAPITPESDTRPWCGDCDGTGWVEGGATLQSKCARCDGSGREPANCPYCNHVKKAPYHFSSCLMLKFRPADVPTEPSR